ncbi:Crp/Fnr family transcriptional regulator [Sphingomonas jatrophae]|uniref:cAMP-binding domain of CRP or a regulatory subunit of cAMP-dependent protein kinases n=1 Tax=Sphingomonas jatrophae TaxID=1166337 RepID=A0A1I6JCI8_9SPHN|nr:Crp/Fnr family transcriptional regulator [Sphingomonas jatrophae]SFR76634.1 cAMP-binding domain of CRP or a regulatory subunit of cAMP-dependent protein kinases [Sphingomonas jatrophae]
MIERHLMKLRARDQIGVAEEAALRALPREVIDVPARRTLIRAGEVVRDSTLLLDGLMCRYKDLSDGQRQLTELHVAGDFVDLHSFTLKRLDHSIMTLTPCRVAHVPHARLAELTERFPHLTRLYWHSTNLDAAIHREWELSLGRRSAVQRLAALFCELYVRLKVVGLAADLRYDLALTQADIGEAMGLTAVHVNRTLRELRERKLLRFRSGNVTIVDYDKLARLGEFDIAYLYLESFPT